MEMASQSATGARPRRSCTCTVSECASAAFPASVTGKFSLLLGDVFRYRTSPSAPVFPSPPVSSHLSLSVQLLADQ
ncbi:unnamed protein product [Danaus chrysippus]|uniref:(African queen) hypothetical protein n=1 Tax=Danaus chrysippus TaxID=151541 RepID=A0A8J2QWB7_9NEOP|nr:unnamed protein product [Danaus chrysippus]